MKFKHKIARNNVFVNGQESFAHFAFVDNYDDCRVLARNAVELYEAYACPSVEKRKIYNSIISWLSDNSLLGGNYGVVAKNTSFFYFLAEAVARVRFDLWKGCSFERKLQLYIYYTPYNKYYILPDFYYVDVKLAEKITIEGLNYEND